MKTFKEIIKETYSSTTIDEKYIKNSLSKYKIPDSYINIYKSHVNIKLPDAEKAVIVPSEIPGINKLKADLKSGKFKDERLISFAINDYYSSENSISLTMAVEKITSNPSKLYHLAKAENIESILKNGLKISSGAWTVGRNSATVYKAVFLLKKWKALKKIQGFKDFKAPKYIALEIEVPSNLELFKDPHYGMDQVESYISFNNIDHKYIRRVQ